MAHLLLMPMSLAEQLKAARETLGLSQRGLAQIAGLSHSVISEVETGARTSFRSDSRDTLIRWAQALQLDPLRVLELAGLEPRRDETTVRSRPPLEELIRTEPTLTSVDRKALLAVLAALRGGHQSGR